MRKNYRPWYEILTAEVIIQWETGKVIPILLPRKSVKHRWKRFSLRQRKHKINVAEWTLVQKRKKERANRKSKGKWIEKMIVDKKKKGQEKLKNQSAQKMDPKENNDRLNTLFLGWSQQKSRRKTRRLCKKKEWDWLWGMFTIHSHTPTQGHKLAPCWTSTRNHIGFMPECSKTVGKQADSTLSSSEDEERLIFFEKRHGENHFRQALNAPPRLAISSGTIGRQPAVADPDSIEQALGTF